MKKKSVISFLVMTAGIAGLGFIAPWWAGAICIVIIAGFSRLNVRDSILTGAFALGLVWVVMARYMSLHDEADIISKTGSLLGGLSHQSMMTATLLIALITGGLSGWFGSVLGNIFRKEQGLS